MSAVMTSSLPSGVAVPRSALGPQGWTALMAAVITVVRMPRMKTTAKPRTGPEPSENSATAAISMVTLESMIVAKAR